MAPRKALIVGLAGPDLLPAEAAYLAAERPAGLILFSRNCTTVARTRALVDAALGAIGSDDTLVAIDQEGGRVQRLKPPTWRRLPSAGTFGTLYARDPAAAVVAARLVARLMADDLRAVGVNMNCAPVLDVPVPEAHGVIGDRAYGDRADVVVALGGAVAQGLAGGGISPVVKHVPGHGRATADSHLALPVVETPRALLERTDFAPFRAIADVPAAMTAHVTFTAIDPAHPASTSPTVIGGLIRADFGFDGLLMSDDVGMQALSGHIADRTRAVLDAGSDVALVCSGRMEDLVAAAGAARWLDSAGERRLARCLSLRAGITAYDRTEAEAALAAVLAQQDRGGSSPAGATSPVESV